MLCCHISRLNILLAVHLTSSSLKKTHIFIHVYNAVSDEFRLHFILQYGLYGAFFGPLLYIILGSCKDVPVGPTAVLSLLTFQQVGELGANAADYAILLCFMTGIIMLGMGILGLGKCTNLICPVRLSYNTFHHYHLWMTVWLIQHH